MRADGTFEYSGLSPQRLFYGLSVSAPGYESQSLKVEIKTADDVITKDVRLKKAQVPETSEKPAASPAVAVQPAAIELPRRTITGTVRSDGQAIQGASVRWARSIWDDSVKPTATKNAGDYVLEQVSRCKGCIAYNRRRDCTQFTPVGKGDVRIDVELSKGTVVRGVVRSSSGKPVAGVRIIPHTHCFDTGIGNPIWLDERAANSDERGEFEIAAVPADGVQFDVLKQGFSEQRNINLKQDGTVNEITLTSGGALTGIVIDDHERPVRNLQHPSPDSRNLVQGEKAGGYYAGFDWYGISFTRDDGNFVFTDVPANRWMRLMVSSPGVGCRVVDRAQSQPLDALPDARELTIRLRPFQPLTVHVSDAASGKPITDAAVGLIEDNLFDKGGFSWGYHDLWTSRSRTLTRTGLLSLRNLPATMGRSL